MKNKRKALLLVTTFTTTLIIGGHFFFPAKDAPQTIVADKLSNIGQLLKMDTDTFATQSAKQAKGEQTDSEKTKESVASSTLENTLNSVIEQSDQSLTKVQEIASDIQEQSEQTKQTVAQSNEKPTNTFAHTGQTQAPEEVNGEKMISSTTAQNVADQQVVATPVANQQTPAQQVAASQEVATDTSGFNFNGHHYPLAWFSGSGYVPADGNIYRWQELPNHFLIERAGSAGATIRELGVGSKVVIDGQTYTVFKVLSHVQNDENAWNILTSQGATVTWQSCDATYGSNGLATLTLWFAA